MGACMPRGRLCRPAAAESPRRPSWPSPSPRRPISAASSRPSTPGRTDSSAVRPLPQAAFALDARLELIRRAQASLDVQSYQLGNDKTGLLILRELRDAARRGVRVRLLLDDFYTAGLDRLLLGAGRRAECRGAPVQPLRERARAHRHALAGFLHRLQAAQPPHAQQALHRRRRHRDRGRAQPRRRVFPAQRRRELHRLRAADGRPGGAAVGAIFDDYWNSDVVYPLQRMVRAADRPRSWGRVRPRHLAGACPAGPSRRRRATCSASRRSASSSRTASCAGCAPTRQRPGRQPEQGAAATRHARHGDAGAPLADA